MHNHGKYIILTLNFEMILKKKSGPASIMAYESANLEMHFDFQKTNQTPSELQVRATFRNLTTTPFYDFLFQAAVPKVGFFDILSNLKYNSKFKLVPFYPCKRSHTK